MRGELRDDYDYDFSCLIDADAGLEMEIFNLRAFFQILIDRVIRLEETVAMLEKRLRVYEDDGS